MTRRAFTLIELLVVIAIIGILVTAVIASLSGAKGKGNDTAVKADLATIQVQATLYYGLGNTYGATNTGDTAACNTTGTVFNDTTTTLDDTIGAAVTSAKKDVKGGSAYLICASDTNTFMVAGQLSTGKYWCVDSKGAALEEATQPSAWVTSCP